MIEYRRYRGTMAYVPEASIRDRLLAGWMVLRDLGPTHGCYSVLMWRCDCRGVA
jgi:hypothetical protein